jgi:CRISPR-associated endonuclease/helicase Cas3
MERHVATIDPCDFPGIFYALTDNRPFPWQEDLYQRLLAGKERLPKKCAIPTGLGKTAVIPIWLAALANKPKNVSRRLVYIVNRRTVVDQSTREAEHVRKNLDKPELRAFAERLRSLCSMPSKDDPPLSISTLRGQFADKGQWCVDPARPAIVVGTVDMIGSRLLFSGYGCGRAKKPMHAGFLGQDSLIVHDEAHLEPAFQELLVAIAVEQKRYRDGWPTHIMEMTATSRNMIVPAQSEEATTEVLALTKNDYEHLDVEQRISAKKAIRFVSVADEKKDLAEKIAEQALDRADKQPDSAILVFVRKVEDVAKVVNGLKTAKIPASQIEQLTGTLRGKERDELVDKPVFQRFLPPWNRKEGVTLAEGSVFLICTSAGEVGVDISADHMVCDLTPFDSMAQRLGRVNRYGEGDAKIDVVYPATFDPKHALTPARENTLVLLQQLPKLPESADGCRYSASPKALSDLAKRSDLPCALKDAFTPEPKILPATDILFDAWALTTIRDKLPGRPPVEPYLHGIADWEPPETHVAWREEVGVITDGLLDVYKPEELLGDYPLKPHELLRDNTDRVFKHLQTLAKQHGNEPVWVVDGAGTVQVTTLNGMTLKDQKDELNDKTVLLPPSVGGLSHGLLDGAAQSADDIADEWWADDTRSQRLRLRVWDDDPEFDKQTAHMRLARLPIDTASVVDEDESENADGHRFWYWYELPIAADSEDTRNARISVPWHVHTNDVVGRVEQLVEKLPLKNEIKKALTLAARFHDLGKIRAVFQRILGNHNYDAARPDTAWAKSGSKRWRGLQEDYRHEFGSLLEIERFPEFRRLDDDMKDLVRHLIASHHGRARPHFPADEAFDPELAEQLWNKASQETPRRFARLQRKYGRWGLAYLESLLRAADWAASAEESAVGASKQEEPS